MISTGANAQSGQPELRVDVLGPPPYSVQPGAGYTIALGYYARVGAVGGYAPRAETRLLADHWRADLITRVTLDPFRESRWGFSVGGGLSFRRQTYLVGLVELEGPQIGELMPALQLGVSGGVRAGFILRRAVKGRR